MHHHALQSTSCMTIAYVTTLRCMNIDHKRYQMTLSIHQVSTFNQTGKPYQGSFNIWEHNRITKLIDLTRDLFIDQTRHWESAGSTATTISSHRKLLVSYPYPVHLRLHLECITIQMTMQLARRSSMHTLQSNSKHMLQSSQSTHLLSELYSSC